MKELKTAILMFIVFTIVCGGIYPAVVTGIAQVAFPKQAKGSLIVDASGKTIGSRLIGQPFSEAGYFWPRPSATTDFAYNPMGSSGSNAGPTNPDYLRSVADRVGTLRASGLNGRITADMVQASASGLDPHISVEAAKAQVARVAKARGVSTEAVAKLVGTHTEDRQLGFLGEPRVNVLALNLALDKLTP